MIKSLSVFFPLFNEEGNVKQAVEKAEKVLKKLEIDYEILLVDDGSSDNTLKIALQIAKTNKYIRVIHHEKNSGYGEALKSGFYNAKYDIIVYTDGDGQFDFSEINKFLREIDNYDLIYGYRIKRQDPFFRILFKQGWKLSLFTFFGLTLKDVDCGFKMVKRKVIEKIPHLESQRGAMINAEIVIKAKKAGFKIGQVGVHHYPRLSGRSTGANLTVIIKSFLDLFKLWWNLKDQKRLFVLLVAVLLLAAFLRFYRIDEYMTFLGDEGRDALIIKRMAENLDFPLIGPPTSVGNIYLGPLYYYLMFIFMVPFGLNPIAAAGMNALIGVLTVALIYYLGKIWFGRIAGLVSAYLYAISPVTIIYSRSSWNPNPAPFFALISIFSLAKINKSGNFLWLILTGISIGTALQMHYLALILIPVCFILWCHEIWYRLYKKEKNKNLLKGTLLGITSFIFTMSPLILFDLKHDFLNYKAVIKLLGANETVKGNILQNISKIPELYFHNLVGRYVSAENFYLSLIVSTVILFSIATFFIRRYILKVVDWPILALGIWLFVGLLGLSFYQNEVYDHYLGFVNPAIFLLFGAAIYYATSYLKMKKILVYSLISVLVLALSFINFGKNPLHYPPNNQLKRTQNVAKFIIKQSGEKDFNFALLADKNYDSAYQFYLSLYGHMPKQVPEFKTMQLFVVCEDNPCQPINNPKYEIAAYGWSKVEKETPVYGLKVYKLVPNPEGK